MPELSLRHYKAVVLVAEHSSFTLAAQKMCVSVPALSKIVREAEQMVGFELFQRSPRAVNPSALGQLFLPSARDVLLAHDRSGESARLIRLNRLGRLRIGGTPMANASFLLPAVRIFSEAHPAIEVTVHDGPPEQLQAELLRGRYDLVVGPTRRGGDGIETLAVCEVPLFFIAPGHEYVGRASIPWQDVVGLKLIFQDSRAVLNVLDLLDRRFVFADWHVVESATTALSMVEQGGGYMISSSYSTKIARAYEVNCLHIVEPEVSMGVAIDFQRASQQAGLLRSVAGELAGIVRGLLSATPAALRRDLRK